MSDKSNRRFEQEVLCHLDIVYRMAVKLCGRPVEAEDLVQETFLRAHRSFSKFELREYGAKPWLIKILHNVFYTNRERAARAPTLFDDLSLDDIAADLQPASDWPDVADGVNWDNFDEELRNALLELSPEYREVIVLWALGDLSYQEIADVMECAIGTVMSRLYRARRKLADALSDFATERRIERGLDTQQ